MATINRSLAWLLPVLLLACTGCTSLICEHPIVDPAEAQPHPELYGAYRFEPAKEVEREDRDIWFMHLGPAGEEFPPGFLQMVFLQPADGLLHSHNDICFAEKVEESYIIHIPETADDEREFINEASAWKPWHETWGPWKYGWDADRVNSYQLMRFTLREGNLHWGMMDADFVINEIEAGRLSGEVQRSVDEEDPQPTSVRITAETPELRSFVERHIADDLFQELDGGHFIRLAEASSLPTSDLAESDVFDVP